MTGSDPDPFELEHGPAPGKPPEEPLDEVLRPAPPLRSYLREKASRGAEPGWTLARGARLVLGFLGLRVTAAVVAWTVLAALVTFLLGQRDLAPVVSRATGMLAVGLLLAGYLVGAIFSHGLVDRVRFGGWVPWAMALAASVAVIVAGAALVGVVLPWGSTFVAVLVPAAGSVGAAAAVTKRTWADV